MADAPAFFFWVFNPSKRRQKLFTRIYITKTVAESLSKKLANPLRFALAQETVVDENTDQPLFDGPMHQGGRYRRIDTAAQRADHAALADLLAYVSNRSLDEMFHRPRGLTSANTKHEVAENLFAAWGVRHFRMKLHAKQA